MKKVKYLVWVGGIYNGFYSKCEAEYEAEYLQRIGYDDVKIEKL